MWREVTAAGAWDDALCCLPRPHALQSWAWGEFKSRWGWNAERWLLSDDASQPRAAVQILRRTLSRAPACVLYAPKGPAAVGLEAYSQALAHIESRARTHRALWAKADGDPGHLIGASDAQELPRLRDLLTSRRWRLSPSQVQFRNTGLTDLRRSDDDLLAAMKPKTRYNVRLAEKRGVRVRVAAPIDAADADALFDMYSETSRRDGFLIRSAPYYFDAWRTMNATALIAEQDGRALAGLVLFRFGDRAWYFYGMSRTAGREHMPSYALQWRAMQWARAAGCDVYDWWGAPEREDDEADGMAGVWRFKQGFDAQFFEGIGAWDYAPSPLLYQAYLKLGPKLLGSG
jgi:lipid II:glycine glycyltransferase (peptidoglycan interpeptide bridge formation enzyme)